MDYTQDTASLLRLGTAKAHERVQRKSGAKLLTNGKLSKPNYILFLIMMWHIYSTLEEALEAHSSDPIISPMFNARLLFKTSAISADIAYFLQTSEAEWKSHPFVSSFCQGLPTEVNNYIMSIKAAASSDLSRLLAHAYVRYLGDLSGGQVIKRSIRKAYGLAEDDSSGTQFYDFEKLNGGGKANSGDIRTIKTWFRDGLNNGIGDDKDRKAVIVDEANIVYRLNEDILELLRKAEEAPNAGHGSPTKLQSSRNSLYLTTVTHFVSMALLVGILHFSFRWGGLVNHGNHFGRWTEIQK